jgi:hypothetical protein
MNVKLICHPSIWEKQKVCTNTRFSFTWSSNVRHQIAALSLKCFCLERSVRSRHTPIQRFRNHRHHRTPGRQIKNRKHGFDSDSECSRRNTRSRPRPQLGKRSKRSVLTSRKKRNQSWLWHSFSIFSKETQTMKSNFCKMRIFCK